MSDVEAAVARHYDLENLLATILAAVGVTLEADGSVPPGRLEPVDEFHIGGAPATIRLLDQMHLPRGARLLDIGSGVGGPARVAAQHAGAEVLGIDLTPSYVALATKLSRLTGTDGQTRFLCASALATGLDGASFDAAMMLHVGMNIADKAALMAEVARLLRPGGVFGIYDIMRGGAGDPTYPLPWAGSSATSFLETAETYRTLALAAGFEVLVLTPRRDEALAFFAQMRAGAEARKAEGLPPPAGIGLIMGENAPLKIANIAAAIAAGVLVPTELILKRG